MLKLNKLEALRNAAALIILSAAGTALWLGPVDALYCVAAAFLLFAGLTITGFLVAALTKVQKLSTFSMMLLFLAKLLWWGTLFKAAQKVNGEHLAAIVVGFSAFFLFLFWLSLDAKQKASQDS